MSSRHFGIRSRIMAAAILALVIAVSVCASPVLAAVGRADAEVTDCTGLSEWPDGPQLNSYAGYLLDLDSGEVLFSQNADEMLYPASMTKVMTAYVVLENSSLDDDVTFSDDAINSLESDAVSGKYSEGDTITVRDCLYAMMLNSDNEPAMALAEHVSGSVEDFVSLMNETAQELGTKSTHYANPTGLYDESHYTSASDMALIYRAALQDEDFVALCARQSYYIDSLGIECTPTDEMTDEESEYYDSDIVCGKTGYIEMAKNTLVSYGSRDDRNVVAVVMRGESREDTYTDTTALMNYGFNEFVAYGASQFLDTAELMNLTAAAYGGVEITSVTPDDAANIVLPQDVSLGALTRTVTAGEGQTGTDRTAELALSINDTEVVRIPLNVRVNVAASTETEALQESQSEGGTSAFLSFLLQYVLDGTVLKIAIIVCAAVMLILLIVMISMASKEKKRRKYAAYRRREKERQMAGRRSQQTARGANPGRGGRDAHNDAYHDDGVDTDIE